MPTSDPKKAALAALRLALRPLFRLLLRSGITWQDASDVCKATLVEVATNEFGLHGRPTNMSRVAIMTGLGRREVRRLRDVLATAPEIEPGRLHSATRVLTGWHLDATFTDDAGLPRELPFEPAAGQPDEPSFSELCHRYGGDLAPVTMRRELARVGALEELASGRLRVLKRYYMPLQMDPDSLVRGGSMLEDLGTSISFNLGRQEDDPRRFVGRAISTRISSADARRFRAWLEREGQAFLEHVDEWLTRHEQPAGDDGAPRPRTLRVGVGVYGIHDDRKT